LAALPSLVRASIFAGWRSKRGQAPGEIDRFCEKHADDVRAVAAVLLPESAGPGSDGAFLEWLKGYDPEGEVLRFMRPPGLKFGRFPLERYEEQLGDLRRSAGVDSLREAPRDRLQALILVAMEASASQRDELYGLPRGRDLFRDILTVFVRESRTLDLAYQKNVGMFTCRGIDRMV
jgi:hypothetical protein